MGISEPAPAAIIAAATENQEYDDYDQKGRGVHGDLLKPREFSRMTSDISRREYVGARAVVTTLVAIQPTYDLLLKRSTACLAGGHVTCGYLALVCGKSSQNLFLLRVGHLEEDE